MILPVDGSETDKNAATKNWVSNKTNLKGDWLNFFLLLLLYTLQGFPLGLTSAIPILLQSKEDMSYQNQALFSLVIWPFSLKLLWAPLIDTLYILRIGRRKSWIIPVQYLMGLCFLYMAKHIDELLPETGKPDIVVLIYMFFVANFLAATQDIVIDGWALTILDKKNVGHASTCNTTGQTIGATLGSVLPVLFTSEDFCNKYLRDTPETGGIVSMQSFLYVWGVIFIFITTLIALLKKEKNYKLDEDYVKLDVVQNYSLLWEIMKMPSIRLLSLALLTTRVGFCVTDSVTHLKLIDAGVSKDDITVIHTAMCMIKIGIPIMTSKYTSGPKPMTVYLNATIIKLLWSLMFIILIYYTPVLITENGIIDIPYFYYAILIFLLCIDEILFYIMFVALLAFFSRISDPRLGGTYITFLNTVANLGMSWTSTVALGVIDLLTLKECSTDSNNYCTNIEQENMCGKIGGDCITMVNGYYVGTIISVMLGFIWYGVFRNVLQKLEMKSPSHWMVNVKGPNKDNIDNTHVMTIS